MASLRAAYRAGQFYPEQASECERTLRALLEAAGHVALPAGHTGIAGIVPHAGWMYSGATAAKVFRALAAGDGPPDTVAIFGAVHVPGVRRASLWARGGWETPLGEVAVDEDLAARLLAEAGELVEVEPGVHEREHSIEVQVPFIRLLWPGARLLPVMVPPHASAVAVGIALAAAVSPDERVVVLGSTDLTHYGPAYGQVSHGTGPAALAWARDENDASMIALLERLDAEAVVPEAQARQNACGPGAVAATLAFARARGATCATLLEHTTSHDVSPRGQPTDFVGYAGVVYSA